MENEREIRNGYLYIQVTGDFDYHQAVKNIPDTFRFCIENDVQKLLVDLRELRGENSLIGRYFFLDEVGSFHSHYRDAGYPPMAVAFVGSDAFVSGGPYERDIAMLHDLELMTTSDINEAMRWLGVE